MKQARIINATTYHCFPNGTLVNVEDAYANTAGNHYCHNVEPFEDAWDGTLETMTAHQYVPVEELQFI